MLEIFVNRQRVDLPTDIQINLTIENPFMLADRIPTPYSLSFSLPPTANNLKLFNWPNRMNAYIKPKEFTCTILFQSLTIAVGVLILSPFDQNISVNFRGSTITDHLRDKLYNIDLGQYIFSGGETGTPDFTNPLNFGGKYSALAVSAAYGNEDFVLAPIRIKTGTPLLPMIVGEPPAGRPSRGQAVPGRPDDMMDSEYFNFWNPRESRASIREDTEPLPDNVANEYAHTSIFPFPRIKSILNHLFGDTLINNVFETEELEDLVLINTFHPRWIGRNWNFYTELLAGMLFNNAPPFVYNPVLPSGSIYRPYFDIKTFMPDISSVDLVKDLLKVFCLSLFVSGGKFVLKYNKDVLADPDIENWSNKIIAQPLKDFAKKQGYKYGYDGYDKKENSEGFFDIVENAEDVYIPVFTPDPARPYNANEKQFRITSTKQEMKRWITEDRLDIEYETISSDFGGNKGSESNGIDMVSKLKPLPMTIAKYWWQRQLRSTDQPTVEGWHVPVWDGERSKRPDESFIMFYRGTKQTFHTGTVYPYLTPYHVDAFGEQVGDLSLSWDDEDHGLIKKFHKEYKVWSEKSKVKISGSVLLSALDFKHFDISKKKHIDGRNFLIEKIQVTIRYNRIDPAVVEFIEA